MAIGIMYARRSRMKFIYRPALRMQRKNGIKLSLVLTFGISACRAYNKIVFE